MALTWALCAALGRRRRPLPCWASPLPPDHGGWHDRRPSGGQDARLLLQLQPPPLDRQTPLSPPPNTLGCPSWWRLQQCRTPLCPLHDLHARALCSSHKVCMGRRGCPTLLLPARCALFCGGEGGRDSACCPVTAPEGGSCSARVADVAAAAPPVPSPGGWQSIDISCPPPEESPTAASVPGAPPPERLGWGSTEAP